MIGRPLLLGVAALVFALMVVLDLAILDVISVEVLRGSLGRIAGVLLVSAAAMVVIALLLRAAARR